jgi:hypothetical protein
MLVLQTAKQVFEKWDILEPAIQGAVPPFAYGDANAMQNIKASLLAGQMHCFVGFSFNGEEPLPFGIVITTFSEDECSGVRNLLIYAIYGYRFLTKAMWTESLDTLRKFAKAYMCHRIVAFSNVEAVIVNAGQLGFDISYHFLTLEV